VLRGGDELLHTLERPTLERQDPTGRHRVDEGVRGAGPERLEEVVELRLGERLAGLRLGDPGTPLPSQLDRLREAVNGGRRCLPVGQVEGVDPCGQLRIRKEPREGDLRLGDRYVEAARRQIEVRALDLREEVTEMDGPDRRR